MHCRLAGTLRRPLGDIMDGRPMSFDEFRKRALESMEGAARRWEDPDADSSMQVMLGQDHYGDFHVIPIPPGYVELERGHVFWLKSSLPAEVINRSLRCLAFRASMWTSSREEYRDQPVRDPERGEAMMVCISDGKRLELWHAPITRSKSAVPALADWDHLTQLDAEFSGAIPKLMRDALNQPEVRMGPLPRVIPAANLVLSAYDVPPEFAPAVRLCGHVPAVAEEATATYRAIFNTTKPGPVIGSTVYVFPEDYDVEGIMSGSVQALSEQQKELKAPALGRECHLFEGLLGKNDLRQFTIVWRHAGIFSQAILGTVEGAYSLADLGRLADIQERRLQDEIRAPSHRS